MNAFTAKHKLPNKSVAISACCQHLEEHTPNSPFSGWEVFYTSELIYKTMILDLG